jgi:hypothetical protein
MVRYAEIVVRGPCLWGKGGQDMRASVEVEAALWKEILEDVWLLNYQQASMRDQRPINGNKKARS